MMRIPKLLLLAVCALLFALSAHAQVDTVRSSAELPTDCVPARNNVFHKVGEGWYRCTARGDWTPIPASEIVPAITLENSANKSTNTSLGTSDTLYPTQKAVKTYADSLVVGLLNDRGSYDASENVFTSSGGSGTVGAIRKGDLWYVSVAGTLAGTFVTPGYSVRALTDTPGRTGANWSILNVGIGYVPENVANKRTSFQATPDDTHYPSEKLVKDQLNLKANTSSLAPIATSGSASDLSTGTLPDARFPATLPALSAANLTALNASNLASGTIADGRLSNNVPLLNFANVFTAVQTLPLRDKGGQVFNAQAYGAVCNGVTDNAAAFTSAIAAASAAGGGIVYVPQCVADYVIGSTVTISPDVHFMGAGIDATVLRRASGFSGYLIVNSQATISGLTIDGNYKGKVFTADSTTDVVTSAGNTLANNDEVRLINSSSSGALPSPLVAGTSYFVRDKSGSTLKLAATQGGTAINLISNGVGHNLISTVDGRLGGGGFDLQLLGANPVAKFVKLINPAYSGVSMADTTDALLEDSIITGSGITNEASVGVWLDLVAATIRPIIRRTVFTNWSTNGIFGGAKGLLVDSCHFSGNHVQTFPVGGGQIATGDGGGAGGAGVSTTVSNSFFGPGGGADTIGIETFWGRWNIDGNIIEGQTQGIIAQGSPIKIVLTNNIVTGSIAADFASSISDTLWEGTHNFPATMNRFPCADLSNASAFCSGTEAENLTGTVAATRLNPSVSAHAFLGNNTGSSAAAAFLQPACADLSNAAASCSTDAANASNISSGTLNVARLGTPGAPQFASVSFGGTKLSAYTEGTFTPTLKFGGATTGITYSIQTAKYTQIGNMVHVAIVIVLTSKGLTTGAATITGLPVAAASTGNRYIVGPMRLVSSALPEWRWLFLTRVQTHICPLR